MPSTNSTTSRYGADSAVSAISASAGLALNAMPSPAVGEHVDVVGAVAHRHALGERHPGLLREPLQRDRLARPVDDLADDPAGEPPFVDLELVGGDEIQRELLGQPRDDLA